MPVLISKHKKNKESNFFAVQFSFFGTQLPFIVIYTKIHVNLVTVFVTTIQFFAFSFFRNFRRSQCSIKWAWNQEDILLFLLCFGKVQRRQLLGWFMGRQRDLRMWIHINRQLGCTGGQNHWGFVPFCCQYLLLIQLVAYKLRMCSV